eukprot:6490665-Amphidinium_carterae.1
MCGVLSSKAGRFPLKCAITFAALEREMSFDDEEFYSATSDVEPPSADSCEVYTADIVIQCALKTWSNQVKSAKTNSTSSKPIQQQMPKPHVRVRQLAFRLAMTWPVSVKCHTRFETNTQTRCWTPLGDKCTVVAIGGSAVRSVRI